MKVLIDEEADRELDKTIEEIMSTHKIDKKHKEAVKEILLGSFLVHKQKEKEKTQRLLKKIEEKIEKWNKEEKKGLEDLEKDKEKEDFVAVGMDGFYLWAIRAIKSELIDVKRTIEGGKR